MPIDAVWIVISIPKKEYEKQLLVAHNKKTKKITRYQDQHLDSNRNEIILGFPLEQILEEALDELGVGDVVWVASKNEKYFQVYFPTDLYENDAILQYLQSKGIGVEKNTSIGYIPFGLFFCNEDEIEEEYDEEYVRTGTSLPGSDTGNNISIGHKMHGFKKVQEEFLKSVTSRLTVAQVVEGVRSSSELTFDFVMYTVFAGCIAAAGLLNNSAVDVAAAMMIEPVMSTVMAMTFGLVVHDKSLTLLGARNCFNSLLICLFVGYVYGMIAFIWAKQWNPPPDGIWPSGEMHVRGLWRTMWYGALQALAAGGAIAVTLLNDNQAALVGVAVAATFLPPFINTGLLWAYATHLEIDGVGRVAVDVNISGETFRMNPVYAPMTGYVPVYYPDMRWEMLALSGVSMIYTLINIVCMVFTAYLLLWVKQVVPLGKMEANKRFFKEDIKVARNYNRKSVAPTGDDTIGQQILEEWAEIAGLDPNTLMSDEPEARVTQLQTLQDIINDVETDPFYQNVTKNAMGRPENLLRRVTMANIYGPRKPSGRPGSVSFAPSPTIWDVEGHIEPSTHKRFSINPITRRRGSKWVPSTGSSESPEETVKSNHDTVRIDEDTITRGLRPQDMEDKARRRSSLLLQKSLKDGDHSPFSVWPSTGNRALSVDLRKRRRSTVAGPSARMASRISSLPRLSTHSESIE